MNILAVDDDATQRKLLKVTLEAEGHTVIEARDGVEALDILKRGGTDAIISDGLMPRMDGYRLCYEVRRDERFRSIPFIIYTSTFTSPTDEKFALELGAGFLRKPASGKEILALLKEQEPRQLNLSDGQIGELTALQEYSERLVTKLEEKNAELVRATEDLRKARDRLEAFASLGRRLNSATTARGAALIIAEAADELFGWDAFTFDLYSTETSLIQAALRIDVIDGRRTALNIDSTPLQPTSRFQRALRDGGQLILRDAPVVEIGMEPFGDTARPSASIIVVPVRNAARVEGVLSIQSYSRNAYDQRAMDTVQSLADYCGSALERIRASAELVESEERFRQLAGNIDKVFWVNNPQNTKIFYVSPAYEKIWGRTCQSLCAAPNSWLEAVHPDDQERVRKEFGMRQESDTVEVMYRIVRPDGEVRWIRDRLFPVQNDRGEFYRTAGFAEDITERKRDEDDLRRSHEQLRALAARLNEVREAESMRIARDIHDILGQQLTTLKMDLVWLRKRLDEQAKRPDHSNVVQRIEAIQSLADIMARSVQQIASDLRPGVLDDLGLVAALEWQAREFEKHSGVECRWKRQERDVALSSDQATAIFRIFQEALSNVARHARARQVILDLTRTGGGLVLEIADDGIGFNEELVYGSKSLGFLGMRERAMLIGASVEASSALGQGTTVRVVLPPAPVETKEKGDRLRPEGRP